LTLRSPKGTVESLHAVIQRLEQNDDPALDPVAKVELKRLLLLRIADIEALSAIESAKPESIEAA
jgi:hypothetical protein